MKFDNSLFEISWEVCNKVGGIHTVITSKIKEVQKNFKNYYLMGPYFESSNKVFEKQKVPKKILDKIPEIENLGIKIHYGKWKVEGEPNVILVEYKDHAHVMNEVKTLLWEKYSIDSLGSNWYDFDEAILWSWCCGIIVEILTKDEKENPIIHAHEWMSGGSILNCKINRIDRIKSIFTTHGTMLGRAMSGHHDNLYDIMKDLDVEKHAYELGVHTKHQTERTLANISDSFTTVSDILANEAKTFYNKSPDIILYNGFDNSSVPTIDIMHKAHKKSKNRIHFFLESFLNKKVDLNKTFITFTSGRNEFRSKGEDILIEALDTLNSELKEENSDIEVINFFLFIIGSFEKVEGNPLSPFNILEDHELISSLKSKNLINNPKDKVKNVVIPIYLENDDGFLSMDYYELTRGMDLGIFPSYYEPWGYTPLESISYGVPTITSDLAGFGISISETLGSSALGVKVIKRRNVDDPKSSEELKESIKQFLNMKESEIKFVKEISKNIALKYDWEDLYKNYLKTYSKVIS